MNIAIVEDNLRAAETLKKFIQAYGESAKTGFEVKHYSDGNSFLEEYAAAMYSIIFMDIDLPGLSGVEVAKRLREKDGAAIIIFITRMAQYARLGYEVNALDFMVKPINYADFCLKLKKAVAIAQLRSSNEIFVRSAGGYIRISVDRLLFVEVMGHQVKYNLVDSVIETRDTLSNVEAALKGYGFLRCNSCYLVNSAFVTAINGYDVKVGGRTLKISHPRRKKFVEELLDTYMGNIPGKS